MAEHPRGRLQVRLPVQARAEGVAQAMDAPVRDAGRPADLLEPPACLAVRPPAQDGAARRALDCELRVEGAPSLKTPPMLDVAATPAPRFAHPQVMLLDVEPAAATFLQEAGFNVSTGSFGTTYGVRAEDGIQQVIMNGNLPSNYTEQEVVIVNLAALSPIDGGQGKTPASIRQNAWWARTDTGLIDPRPGFMVNFQRDFDRILGHGGVFIIFADAREEQGLIFGHVGRDVINHGNYSGGGKQAPSGTVTL